MDTSAIILALSLPVGTITPLPDVNPLAAIKSMADYLVQHEYIDPSETQYFFVDAANWNRDLDIARERYLDLRDTPGLWATIAYPPYEYADQLRRLNRRYLQYLQDRAELELDRQYILYVVITETKCLYNVWDNIADLQNPYFRVSSRRSTLKRLIELGYPPGAPLPPSVPTWRMP